MANANFSCTALMGVNKVGKLKQDQNGYYEIVLGALNILNSAGEYYVYEEAKKLFEESSSLMRRVKRGALRAEYDHPQFEPGMTDQDFFNRVQIIDPKYVCAHIAEITLDFDNVKDSRGNKVIAIVGKIKPSGPYGATLEKQLQNPKENVCFSIRSLADVAYRGGQRIKILKKIITWDYVNEPGIEVANKYQTPSLETIGPEYEFSRATVEKAMEESNSIRGISHEAVREIKMNAMEVMDAFGWSVPKEDIPAWTKLLKSE